MNKDPLYLAADFYMVRAPVFSIEDYFSIFKENVPVFEALNSEQKELLQEAITIASPELNKAMKNKKEVSSSLVKYISRMATRSTPFGTFSFVSTGSWKEKTEGKFDHKEIKKRARPDMEWVWIFIERLTEDTTLFPYLYLQKNPLIYDWGGRICLNYIRKKKSDEKTETVSIRSSFLTTAIFKLTKNPILFSELIEKILLEHPTLDKEKLERMVGQLIKQQYLSFTLVPSLLTESPYDDLISKLSKTPFPIQSLNDISQKINSYNQTTLGQEQGLEPIQKLMEALGSTHNLIQVDSAIPHPSVFLPESIKNDLQEAVHVLWNLAPPFDYPLQSFLEKYLEKYGVYRIVPLLDLLHEEAGLGLPEQYLKQELSSKNNKDTKWKKWLKQKFFQCLHSGNSEIEITDNELKKQVEATDSKKAALSLDLFFELIANAAIDIDAGNYLLLLTSGSWQGGATFGRFLDILEAETKEQLKTFLSEEETLEQNATFAESSYFSYLSRNANVSIQPNLRKYSIDISDVGSIHLEDIYVGATLDRFYLTLKNSNKELIVTSGNMLNVMTAPNPLRFIRDVSNYRLKHFMTFSWGELNESPFLPRVKYKKVILSQAQWKLDLLQLNLTDKDSLDNIKMKFQEWSKEWKLPRFCYIGEGDNRILLDLNCPAHVNEVISLLKKNQRILFLEKVGQEEGQWIKSGRGTHLSEYVLPFRKNPVYNQEKPITVAEDKAISSDFRLKMLGSEWLFVKCYLGTDQENRFLIEFLQPFIHSLLEQKLISDWFFVRYGDTKSHVRLRFKGNGHDLTSKLVPILHDWTHQLIKAKCMNEIVFCPYDREIERYGGEKLIEDAERIFCADSVTSFSLLTHVLSKKITEKEEVISAISIIDFLSGLGMDLDQQIAFFSSQQGSKEELKGFREHKSSLLALGEAVLEGKLHKMSPLLWESFEKRKGALNTFAEKIQHQDTASIYSSMIHMHCNRLIGREAKKESKARLYAQHTLTLIKEKSNRKILV